MEIQNVNKVSFGLDGSGVQVTIEFRGNVKHYNGLFLVLTEHIEEYLNKYSESFKDYGH